jgi:hypothetical protein
MLANVSCPEVSISGMHCSPCCPMMAKAAQARAVEEMKVPPSCCNVSHSKPVPVAELQTPTSSGVIAVEPDTEVLSAPPVSNPVERDVDLPLPDTASAQSLLCTFLI